MGYVTHERDSFRGLERWQERFLLPDGGAGEVLVMKKTDGHVQKRSSQKGIKQHHCVIQSLRVLSLEHMKAPFCTKQIYPLVFSRHLGVKFLCLAHESRCFCSGWSLSVATLHDHFFEDSAVQTLRQELTSLRIEVHRARELISGYNEVLDSCERDYRWLQWSTKVFATGNLILGFVLIGLFLLVERSLWSGSVVSCVSFVPSLRRRHSWAPSFSFVALHGHLIGWRGSMAAPDRTLNIPEPQVLLHFPGDHNGFDWHHRVLLHKVGQGRWVVLSPDLELSVEDLSARRHVVLGRHACSTSSPSSAGLLHFWWGGSWRAWATETSSPHYGRHPGWHWCCQCHSYAMDCCRSQFKAFRPVTACRLGWWHHCVGSTWVGAMGVRHRICGWDGGRWDCRLQRFKERSLRRFEDHWGSSWCPLKATVFSLWESRFHWWGSLTLKTGHSRDHVRSLDYLKAIMSGPGDILGYHLSWLKSSGVHVHSAVVHEHKCLCEAVRLGFSTDQLDLSNLASFEHIVRRLVVLEIAVARSPHAPDFQGPRLGVWGTH